jgi:hypothetical protein
MLIFPEESEKELFLDIWLTDADIDYLKGGKMLSDEIVQAMNAGKKICVGILNARFQPSPEPTEDE